MDIFDYLLDTASGMWHDAVYEWWIPLSPKSWTSQGRKRDFVLESKEMRAKSIIVAAVGLVTAASLVSADTTLHFDVQDVTATASGVTSASTFTSQIAAGYSGTISISIQMGPASRLADVSLLGGGGPLPGFFTSPEPLKAITGEIFVGGVGGNIVTGGWFIVEAYDSAALTTSTTYSASLRSGMGSLSHSLSGLISVDGLTFDGLFSSSTFAGASVLPFFLAQPLNGSFADINMNPTGTGGPARNESGIFDNSQFEVFITIPLPTTSGLAFVGMFGLAVVRRRR